MVEVKTIGDILDNQILACVTELKSLEKIMSKIKTKTTAGYPLLSKKEKIDIWKMVHNLQCRLTIDGYGTSIGSLIDQYTPKIMVKVV